MRLPSLSIASVRPIYVGACGSAFTGIFNFSLSGMGKPWESSEQKNGLNSFAFRKASLGSVRAEGKDTWAGAGVIASGMP